MADDDKKRITFDDDSLHLDNIDKDPFFDTYDVFSKLNLRGVTLVKAMDVVLQKAKELYASMEDKLNVKKIYAYKYHEGKFEKGVMSEEDIMKNVNKSISLLDYDRAIKNLVALANFYKISYYKSRVYEPFFKYVMKIFDKFKEIEEVIEKYEEKKFEIDKLVAENTYITKENSELRGQVYESKKLVNKFDTYFRQMFLNEKVIKFYMGVVDRKIIKTQQGYTVLQIVSRILWSGRMETKELCRSLGLTAGELKKLIEPYKELFVFIDAYIDLNYDYSDIKRQKLLFEYDEILKRHGLDKLPDIEKIEKEEEETKMAIEKKAEEKARKPVKEEEIEEDLGKEDKTEEELEEEFDESQEAEEPEDIDKDTEDSGMDEDF